MVIDEATVQAHIVALLTASFPTASVLVNDPERAVTGSRDNAPYLLVMAADGFDTDGCNIIWEVPVMILEYLGTRTHKTAYDAFQVTRQSVIDLLSADGLVLRLASDGAPDELIDEHLSHEFIVQRLTVTAGGI